jgi:segregation and condensation protein B
LTLKRMKATVEALLFSTMEPLTIKEICHVTEASPQEVQWAIAELEKEYGQDGKGIELAELGDGFIFATRADYAAHVQRLIADRKSAPLSYAALETLAIIAYQQPVTRSEIEKIRGVNADRTVQTLLERQLIREVGRLDSPGRPIVYGTTQGFMVHFGLKNLDELPAIDLEEISVMEEADKN